MIEKLKAHAHANLSDKSGDDDEQNQCKKSNSNNHDDRLHTDTLQDGLQCNMHSGPALFDM